jgi:uncharacterized protein YcfJ
MLSRTAIFTLVGIVAGAVVGYLYYHFIGCQTGSCPLTSQPLPSTLYGAFTGGFILNSFTGTKKKDKEV